MIPTSWPYSPGAYEAFAAIKTGGFTLYCCGDRRTPHAIVAAYDWGGYVDVINIRGMDRVTAAQGAIGERRARLNAQARAMLAGAAHLGVYLN